MTPDPDKSGKLFYDPSIKNWDYVSEKKNRENELWKLRKNIKEDSKKMVESLQNLKLKLSCWRTKLFLIKMSMG